MILMQLQNRDEPGSSKDISLKGEDCKKQQQQELRRIYQSK